MTPQQCLYESVKDRIPYSFEEFEKRIKGWQLYPVYEGEELIGCAARYSSEVHLGLIKHNKFIRKVLREVLGTVLREHGHAFTLVDSNNEKGIRFCERLGFEVQRVIDGVILMKCIRSRYV